MSTFFIARDNACTGRCRQGRDCTCMHQRNGGQRIDTEQMLASGVIEGPFRHTHPVVANAAKKIAEFWQVYRMYRRSHSPLYAFQRARQIAFGGLPF